MDPDRLRQVEALLHAALEQQPEARGQYLAEACKDDERLRREVESLIDLAHSNDSFLEPATTPPRLACGDHLGRYRILSEIRPGSGGMGEVYRARDTRLPRDVAVKVLPAHWLSDPDRRRRFEREAQAISSLTHERICTLYDVGQHNGRDFLVMELVEGTPLDERLKRGPLPVPEALARGIEIADALSAAHRKGIVHRDLKPGNVMLTKSGAKLLDFGLARFVDTGLGSGSDPGQVAGTPDDSLTSEGIIVGTPQYMAPEQLEGKPADTRTDVFAFGTLLYEMLTGKPAFEGSTHAALSGAILHTEPSPPSELVVGVPKSLDGVVSKCLRKDPKQRYLSAETLLEVLRSTVGHDARGEAVPVVVHRSGRGWRPTVATLGALLATLATASWLWWSRPPDDPPSGKAGTDPAYRVVVLPFTFRGTADLAYYGDSMVDLLSSTLHFAGRLRTVGARSVFGMIRQYRRIHTTPPPGPGVELDEARAVARGLGAGRFVVGEIVEVGGRVRIAAHLHLTEGRREPIEASVEGNLRDLISLNDSLTRQLAVAELPRSGGPLALTATRTTENLEALKAFLRGEQSFRAWLSNTDSTKSLSEAFAAYSEAAENDPTFALASYRRSQLAYFSGEAVDRIIDFARTAYGSRDKLPSPQKEVVEAHWAFVRGAAQEAQAIYREVLKNNPDDIEGLLGFIHLSAEYGWLLGGPFNSHRSALERYRRNLPDDSMGQWFLKNLEAQEGNCEAAHSLTQRFSGSKAHVAIAAFCGPPSPARRQFLRGAPELPTARLKLSQRWVSEFSHSPQGALELGRLIDQRGESDASDLLFLAELEMTLGRHSRAHKEFDRLATVYKPWALEDYVYWRLLPYLPVKSDELRSLRHDLERWDAASVPDFPKQGGRARRHDGLHKHVRSYLLGRVAARLGLDDVARGYADDIERFPSPADAGSLSVDLAQSIRAHVHWAKGQLPEALQALEAAPRLVPFHRREEWVFTAPQDRYLKAEILRRLDRPIEALSWYQSLGYWPPPVLAGPSHLGQAEMHERLGQQKQAAEQYRKLIDLWSNCDQELRPLVDRAERALRQPGM